MALAKTLWTTIVNLVSTGQNVSDNLDTAFNNIDTAISQIDANTVDITSLKSPNTISLVPQTTVPTPLVTGKIFFDNKTGSLSSQNSFGTINLGYTQYINVVNNTGEIITKGSACRNNGVAGGKIQVVKSIANSLQNSIVLGIAANDIAIGGDGMLITSGQLVDMNTSGMTIGVPLYLSDTVAGTYSTTIPDIITQVGGALTSDAITGIFYVKTNSNISVPTLIGGISGQASGAYSLTTTPQDIINYSIQISSVLQTNISTGEITITNSGIYRANFSSDILFASSASTRSITIELYNLNSTSVIYKSTHNIPRDSTEDGISFNVPINANANEVYKLRARASDNIDITFNDISFDIQSITII